MESNNRASIAPSIYDGTGEVYNPTEVLVPDFPKSEVQEPETENLNNKEPRISKKQYLKLLATSVGSKIIDEIKKGVTKIPPKAKKIILLTLAGMVVFTYADDIYKTVQFEKTGNYSYDVQLSAPDGEYQEKYVTSPSEMAILDAEYLVKMQVANLLKNKDMDEDQRNSIIASETIKCLGLAAKRYVATFDATYKNATEEEENDKMSGWLQDYYSTLISRISAVCSIKFPESVIVFLDENGLGEVTANYNYFTNNLSEKQKGKVTDKEKIKNAIEVAKYSIRTDPKSNADKVIADTYGIVAFNPVYGENGIIGYTLTNSVGEKHVVKMAEDGQLVIEPVQENAIGGRL